MPWRILIGLVVGLLSQAGALQEWISKKSQNRRLAELSGIYESIVNKDPEELLVHNSDHDNSEFLPRDIQEELIQNIESRTPVLIVGPSMSGKTRLVVETVRKNYPSTPVWFPKKGEDIRNVYNNNLLKRDSIIIFDNIDEFLSDQALSFGQFDEWIQGSCVIIATMIKSSYMPWCNGDKNKLPGWGVINRFTVLQMKALLTDNEQTALLNSSYANLAATVEKVGLAPLLGGAPAVRQRLEEGREQHLWGYALVRAAADWRRVGLGPATKRQIQEVALVFKDDIAWDEPDWEEAWAWASEKLHDIVSPIHQTGPRTWEVLDLVADEADWSLNQQTLEAMASTEHSPRQALAISLTMHMLGTLDNDNPAVKQILKEADKFLHEFTTESTPDPNSFGLYAFFLTNVRGDHDQAQTMFERAIEADPNHADNLGAYAIFLETIQGDHDQAQTMYERAITANPNHARNLGAYAIFLETIQGDHDQAEKMLERAIEADPNHADNLRSYDIFLETIHCDFNRAAVMFERAIDADPNNANNLSNYSQLLFATGRDKTAIALVTRALSLAGTDEKPLVAECRFYLFAHSPEHRRESGEELRDLLAAGVTTGSWSFESDLERLRREEDPRHDLVRDVADALRSGDTRTLEARGEWYAL